MKRLSNVRFGISTWPSKLSSFAASYSAVTVRWTPLPDGVYQAGTYGTGGTAVQLLEDVAVAEGCQGFLHVRDGLGVQASDARFELRNALLPIGEVRLALEHLRQAERLAEASGDVRRLGWASTSMTNCLVMVGDLGEAHRVGERAAQLADAFADTPLTIVSRTDLGVVHQERGETERAIVLFREALGCLRPEHGLEPSNGRMAESISAVRRPRRIASP